MNVTNELHLPSDVQAREHLTDRRTDIDVSYSTLGWSGNVAGRMALMWQDQQSQALKDLTCV